ncbi:hypothetical protein V6N11_082739 [Hibiscus sabdariffa]|uniref:Uncharacterized protein n=1 Tax=Hibiscus sabdariffa TaxID=183260 RepID=A0ABR2QJT2_9ROSI
MPESTTFPLHVSVLATHHKQIKRNLDCLWPRLQTIEISRLCLVIPCQTMRPTDSSSLYLSVGGGKPEMPLNLLRERLGRVRKNILQPHILVKVDYDFDVTFISSLS